jgi:protein TonB
MKLALFFLLSLAVHAAVFLIPISLNGPTSDHAITVTVLPIESLPEPSGGSGGGRAAVNRVAAKNFAKTPVKERPSDSTSSSKPAALEQIPVEKLPGGADNGVMAIAEVSTVGIPARAGDSFTAGNGAGGNNYGFERIGAGIGNGSGNGHGSGTGQAEAGLTQVRYRETPQPQYPDSARREGKEGRVLLRVLVDEKGRTKAIEVNQSSGHDLLDRAATEAIKKWRFVPARAGTKPVETWVKVPIEFQLSNAEP